MLTRQHPDDKLVTRYVEHGGGIRIEWEDHLTGEVYGGVFPHEQGREIMASEGLDPDEFHPRLGEI